MDPQHRPAAISAPPSHRSEPEATNDCNGKHLKTPWSVRSNENPSTASLLEINHTKCRSACWMPFFESARPSSSVGPIDPIDPEVFTASSLRLLRILQGPAALITRAPRAEPEIKSS